MLTQFYLLTVHIKSIYYWLGTILSTLHILTNFMVIITLWGRYYCYVHCIGKKTDQEKLSTLSRIWQLMNYDAEIQSQNHSRVSRQLTNIISLSTGWEKNYISLFISSWLLIMLKLISYIYSFWVPFLWTGSFCFFIVCVCICVLPFF